MLCVLVVPVCPDNCGSCSYSNGQSRCASNGCNTGYATRSADGKCYGEYNKVVFKKILCSLYRLLFNF